MPTRLQTLRDAIVDYEAKYSLSHRPKGTASVVKSLRPVRVRLGALLPSEVDETRVLAYIKSRQSEDHAGNRAINMEVAEMARVIGRPWSQLWPKVRRMEENADIGVALTPEESGRLLAVLPACASPHLATLVPLLLLTGMRSDEAFTMTWQQVDFGSGTVRVGRAKTRKGTGRIIPFAPDLRAILERHKHDWTLLLGTPEPAHYLFPWGSPPSDPCRPVTTVKTSWAKLRRAAGVQCRLHDLRHTFATQLAEAGVPESTMLALMGHMSRAMLERYSHIRMAAKREAISTVRLPVPPETTQANHRSNQTSRTNY